jgi:hypothetical protein
VSRGRTLRVVGTAANFLDVALTDQGVIFLEVNFRLVPRPTCEPASEALTTATPSTSGSGRTTRGMTESTESEALPLAPVGPQGKPLRGPLGFAVADPEMPGMESGREPHLPGSAIPASPGTY